jgi:hypothetical protein
MTTADAVAAYGLRSAHEGGGLDGRPDQFAVLVRECEQHRLLGLLARAVHDGALDPAPEDRAELEVLFQSWLGHDVRVERVLLRARACLWRAGIPSRALKGVALAHTAYPDPAVRVFGDVDLLVPSGRMTEAVDALQREFATTRVQPELAPGFDDRFGKEVMMRCGDVELDVHRIFVEGALGLTIDTDELFAPPMRFALGGMELEALPMPQRLLHACYAAALGDWPPRLVSLRDVAQLVLYEQPNLVDVLMMARHWQCEVVVARAVTTAWERLQLLDRPPIVEWAARYAPSRRERVLLAAHEGSGRAFSRHLAALLVLPGPAARLAYARAIAFPQPAYLRARGMTVGSHASRALRRVVG